MVSVAFRLLIFSKLYSFSLFALIANPLNNVQLIFALPFTDVD